MPWIEGVLCGIVRRCKKTVFKNQKPENKEQRKSELGVQEGTEVMRHECQSKKPEREYGKLVIRLSGRGFVSRG